MGSMILLQRHSATLFHTLAVWLLISPSLGNFHSGEDNSNKAPAPPPPPPSPPKTEPPPPPSSAAPATSAPAAAESKDESSSASMMKEESASADVSASEASSSSSSSSSNGKITQLISSSDHSRQSESDLDKEDRYHPDFKDDEDACKYSGEWGDCDPFKMIRVKEQVLISGSVVCEEKKNITKPCSRDDFPPGTVWLLNEHKLCVQELQKLKTMIDDLHRYIDLIHQRGQALFNAYNALRTKLGDIRREISIIGRKNHDAEQTIK